MDKLGRVKKEIERRYREHKKKENNYASSDHFWKAIECKEILSFMDSMQEEPVSIWHDGCEIPKSSTNILMIRKDEEDSNYPPIAGCFHGTNSRLDGRNWGYYNGFCYNEIDPPLKWAYFDDLLNLSNVERTVKDWKEEPVSGEWIEELRTKLDSMSKEDFKKVFDKYAVDLNEEPVSEELYEAVKIYTASLVLNGEGSDLTVGQLKGVANKSFKAGAQWQKEQFENNRLKHCNSITNEQAELEQGFIDQHLDKHQRMPTFLDAIEYGIQLQKQQMMTKAVDGTLLEGHLIRQEGITHPLHSGEKVKLVVIKED